MKRLLTALLLTTAPMQAQVVDYDAGTLTLAGVQLMRDASDPFAWYYLPQFPRLATNEAGEFELLLMQVVRADEESDQGLGGILHAMVEFSLPEELEAEVAALLEDAAPGGRLAGALPLLEPSPTEAEALGSFRVISATLDAGADEVNGRVLTSGPAPLRPGARAAIAARLTPEEAVLLMDSLTGTTSDLSVAVRGYYEARVQGYNAVVEAQMDTIYAHNSVVDSFQEGYTRRQVRDITDELIQDGAISVEVFDRSEGLGIDAGDFEKIVDLVTDRLIETMFDATTGWSRTPEAEVAVTEGQIADRLERGWLAKVFLDDNDRPYYTDDQYVMKDREDIRSNTFRLDLSRSTTLRLPFDSTGNFGGFYDTLSDEDRARHFRVVVPSEVASREVRDVVFQVDGAIAEGFEGSFNSVAVNIRLPEGTPGAGRTEVLHFTPESLESENGLEVLELFRQGVEGTDWTRFEYQTVWSLRGGDTPIRVPEREDDWLSSTDALIPLNPPLDRVEVTLDVDTFGWEEAGIVAAEVQIATTLQGDVQFVEDRLVRATAPGIPEPAVFWRDPGEDIAWRAIWYTRQGRVTSDFELLDGRYLFVLPPEADWLAERLQ
ncbi:hypothetical protein [Roseobacter sp. HKCCA0434]|uniref:hypothetical protein n=1 Tax=Roseobacter sp. HKCCA0434 TaxID=3079297 RepID=UPI002905A5A7|nr:hypothetical protein [Roseobacter sp. HKCCA0434]